MTKQEVQNFRGDFQNAVAQLEKQYGVNISLGTITYNSEELRVKMTARKGEKIQKLSKNDFNVGDIVSINHKKINSNLKFKIVKINNKNIKVKAIEGFNSYSVSPSLLVK
jgi:hypothetical protein|tara:strand:- start:334 stop:663 length:330 start_codon:yes stop_codon:yes gene_type:complete